MALVSTGYELVVTFADTGDNRTNRTYSLTSADDAAAVTDTAALLADIAAVTNAEIVGYSLNHKFLENAFALPAAAEIENQAFFSGKIVGDPTDSAILSIPAPPGTIMTALTGPGYNIVDMNDAAVQAFIGNFGPGGVATLSDGETWDTATVSGKRRHVKSTKG
jgi:hypothetical protein